MGASSVDVSSWACPPRCSIRTAILHLNVMQMALQLDTMSFYLFLLSSVQKKKNACLIEAIQPSSITIRFF